MLEYRGNFTIDAIESEQMNKETAEETKLRLKGYHAEIMTEIAILLRKTDLIRDYRMQSELAEEIEKAFGQLGRLTYLRSGGSGKGILQ